MPRSDRTSSGIVARVITPVPGVEEPEDLVAVDGLALADDGPDDGVEPGAIAASGQHTDSHCPLPYVSMAWDSTRPVPWKKRPDAVRARTPSSPSVLFTFLGKGFDPGLLSGVVVGGVLYALHRRPHGEVRLEPADVPVEGGAGRPAAQVMAERRAERAAAKASGAARARRAPATTGRPKPPPTRRTNATQSQGQEPRRPLASTAPWRRRRRHRRRHDRRAQRWRSTRAATSRGVAYREFTQHFPRPGWVEHDAVEIWTACGRRWPRSPAALDEPVAAIGITNQRETVVAWDRRTGRPLHRAIVWQDRRTADRCDELAEAGHLPLVRERTGLVLDPYFSGHQDRVAARPRAAWPPVPTWRSARSTPGCCGTSRAAPSRHRPVERQPHDALRHRRPALDRRAGRPVRRAAGGAGARCGRRAVASAPPSTVRAPRPASRCRASPATSRPRCSGRPASTPA